MNQMKNIETNTNEQKPRTRNCQVGWVDTASWDHWDWEPGEVPETNRAIRAYERRLKERITQERYTDLVESGIEVRVVLENYDDEGADIAVYCRFKASSGGEFGKMVEECLMYVPCGHAFDVLFGRLRFTEDDFEDGDEISESALRRIDASIRRSIRRGARI